MTGCPATFGADGPGASMGSPRYTRRAEATALADVTVVAVGRQVAPRTIHAPLVADSPVLGPGTGRITSDDATGEAVHARKVPSKESRRSGSTLPARRWRPRPSSVALEGDDDLEAERRGHAVQRPERGDPTGHSSSTCGAAAAPSGQANIEEDGEDYASKGIGVRELLAGDGELLLLPVTLSRPRPQKSTFTA